MVDVYRSTEQTGTSFVSPGIPSILQRNPSTSDHLRISPRPKLHIVHRPYRCCAPRSLSERWPLPELPTPLSEINFRNRKIFVKRDDTLNFHGVRGSKLRKLHHMLVDRDIDNNDCVISYGGGQSNAMLALANLCKYRNKPFIYITRPIPKHLFSTDGNFKDALNANMHHVQLDIDLFRQYFTDLPPDSIRQDACSILKKSYCPPAPISFENPYFVPQGGAWPGAEYGISLLAEEIRHQVTELRNRGALVNKRPILFLPCGTGTTAFYLQKYLVDIIQVVAVPVSGSEIYLIKQMRWLNKPKQPFADHGATTASMQTNIYPSVLRPRLRASFADVRPDKLKIWQELSRSADKRFEFDLIYAPKAWEEVMLAVEQGRVAQDGQDIIYYHTGGVEGNVSMLGT